MYSGILWEISGFSPIVVKVFAFLACYAALVGGCLI